MREAWTADELAQELYAMFDSQVPSNTDSTVSINPPTGTTVAPITLGNIPDNPNQPILRVTGQDGSVIGGLTLGQLQGESGTTGVGGGGATTTIFKPSMFPMQITGGGPGQGPYTALIYPNGIAAASVSVLVTQLQIDPGDTIPPGTWDFAIQVGPQNAPLYYCQVPVWVA